jgi:restriction endonuclease S subunit
MSTTTYDSSPLGNNVLAIDTWSSRNESPSFEEFEYIDIASIDRGKKTIVGTTLTDAADAPSRARQMVQANDVLVSTVRPNLNAVAVVPEELNGAIASTGFCVLRSHPERLCHRYLFHWVRSPFFVADMVRKATGASYPAVSDAIIRASMLPLPPLSEQTRIADILDKADSIRRKRQEAIDGLKKLDNCLFEETFGSLAQEVNQWPTALLDDVLFFQEGPGVRNWQFTDSGVKLLNVRNLVDGRLELGNTDRFLSEEEAYGKYQHFLVETDDLVMATSGVTWGKTAWVNSSHLPLCMNTSTIRFRPLNEDRVTRSYMHAFLKSRFFTRQIDRLVTGSAQPNFGPSHLKQVEITIPDMDSQVQYHKRFERFTALFDNNINVLQAANNLFNSLVQRAFTGEL